MNILMVTNTFTPHVGGVARSVEGFSAQYRKLGHRVLVAAPEFENMPKDEVDVVRIRALQNFNGSDFSVPLPITHLLRRALEKLRPDLVHSHHPFLLGDSAARVAVAQNIPLVFTHHTMYEQYTHYVPGDSAAMKRFAIDLATGYANLCDAVIAPSESIAEILQERGVDVPIEVIPTGVDRAFFASGDGPRFRRDHGIPADAMVVGHVGRLAPEKNLDFLCRALASLCEQRPAVHVVIVGDGPSRGPIAQTFEQRGLGDRLHLPGVVDREFLPSTYAAMDVFAFSSKSETQGMVLTEAIAAGIPPVAIDAPGAREVVRDRQNGRLLRTENLHDFVEALGWTLDQTGSARESLNAGIEETTKQFAMLTTADQALDLYQRLTAGHSRTHDPERTNVWITAQRRLGEEWNLLANRTGAARNALSANASGHDR